MDDATVRKATFEPYDPDNQPDALEAASRRGEVKTLREHRQLRADGGEPPSPFVDEHDWNPRWNTDAEGPPPRDPTERERTRHGLAKAAEAVLDAEDGGDLSALRQTVKRAKAHGIGPSWTAAELEAAHPDHPRKAVENNPIADFDASDIHPGPAETQPTDSESARNRADNRLRERLARLREESNMLDAALGAGRLGSAAEIVAGHFGIDPGRAAAVLALSLAEKDGDPEALEALAVEIADELDVDPEAVLEAIMELARGEGEASKAFGDYTFRTEPKRKKVVKSMAEPRVDTDEQGRAAVVDAADGTAVALEDLPVPRAVRAVGAKYGPKRARQVAQALLGG